MKIAAVALCLVAGAMTVSTALATDCEFVEKQAWMINDGEWVLMPYGQNTAKARCWSYVTRYADSCNKEEWNLTLKHEASMAQWMIISMTGDGFHWGIRKPGDYCSDCVSFWFRSNYDVEVTFEDFEDLAPIDPDVTIDPYIEVMYALSDQGDAPPDPDDPSWMTADDLNMVDIEVHDSRELHYDGWGKHIWAKIHVEPCNGPTDWVDPDWAIITCTLDNIRPWIDPDTGFFDGMPDFPFQ
jgi:hypothetical protein